MSREFNTERYINSLAKQAYDRANEKSIPFFIPQREKGMSFDDMIFYHMWDMEHLTTDSNIKNLYLLRNKHLFQDTTKPTTNNLH